MVDVHFRSVGFDVVSYLYDLSWWRVEWPDLWWPCDWRFADSKLNTLYTTADSWRTRLCICFNVYLQILSSLDEAFPLYNIHMLLTSSLYSAYVAVYRERNIWITADLTIFWCTLHPIIFNSICLTYSIYLLPPWCCICNDGQTTHVWPSTLLYKRQ